MSKHFTKWLALICMLVSSSAFSHGLISDPPSRNWICGAITKPDQVANGTAQYPVCGDAYNAPGMSPQAGYSFMSVLTHTTGRDGIGPRENVCSFNSETWNGAATPWDQPINWPTNNISAGSKTFTWDISWGPHFDDTAEFKYWITKSDFQYQTGVPLSFDDFESTPFCSLAYDHSQPNANPNIIPNTGSATFKTTCTIPQRSGRHVIYAEWGRNHYTYERFHTCVDVAFQGTGQTVNAAIALNPDVSSIQGQGSIQLDGRGSSASPSASLSYQWTVSSANPGLYTLTNANQSVATLTYAQPQASGNVAVSLVVTGNSVSDSATRTIVHSPSTTSNWFDLGVLTTDPITMVVGDRVQVRTVNDSGQDAYWPSTPLTITSSTTDSAAWPVALASAINSQNGAVRVGVLSSQGTISPQQSSTANRIYALTSANIGSAFLIRDVGDVPSAPTGVAASAGNAQATVTWSAVSGATGYNVKRSTTSGGPYSNVATNVTATSYTNTGLTNGTTYYYVITAVNASGESAISSQASAQPQGTSTGDGGVTVTSAVTSQSPWYNEQQVRIANTGAITNLSVTVVVQKTTGLTHSGQYNTLGGQVTQSVTNGSTTITYKFDLASGVTLSPGTGRTFAVQTSGSGNAHATSGDTYTVTYTAGGNTYTQTGTF
jgi:chitin-binding protein